MSPATGLGNAVDPMGMDAPGEGRIGERQRRLAVVVSICLIAVGAVVSPFAERLMAPSAGAVGAHSAAMFTLSLVLATLLVSKGAIEGHGDSIRLGYAYFFLAVITIARSAAIPQIYAPGYLIGQRGTAQWLWLFRHAGFASLIAYYAWRARQPMVKATPPTIAMPAIVGAVVLMTLVSALGVPYLPSLRGTAGFWTSNATIAYSVVLAINVSALASVLRLGCRTPKQLWVAVGMVAACVEVWLTWYGVRRYSAGWYVAKLENVVTTLAVLVSHLRELTVVYSRATTANTLLRIIATKDGLTGLDNRRRFDEALDFEWKRARREKRVISLLLIDVDFFKKYNDRYGHVQGDECLRAIAAQVAGTLRRGTDLVARYGGEEFAVLLPSTDITGAQRVAQNLLEAVRGLAITHDGNPPRHVATLSIGIASALPGAESDATLLVQQADAALYAAKEAGRDRAETNRAEPAPSATSHSPAKPEAG